MILIGLLVIAAVLFVLWLIAKEFEGVAQAKGYYARKYFWMCFFLGMTGYMLVIALPNKNAVQTGAGSRAELPEL